MVVVAGLLALTVGVSAFLRIYQIGKLSFWNDEINTVIFATPNLKDMFRILWPKEINMSLYYMFVHFWIRIFPNASEGMLRVLSVIFSVASIPAVFLLGKTMGVSRKKATVIGLVAALLVALNAYHIQYGQEFRAYSLVFLLATLSTFLFIKAIEQPPDTPNYWWRWYAIVSAAAVYSHFFMVFVLVAQVASLFVLFLGNIQTFHIKLGLVSSGVAIAVLITPLAVATFSAGAGGLAWIPEPTLGSVNKFVIELTGKQGGVLLALYFFAGSIGLLAGVGAWLQKNLITKWKFTLMANCLLLPVAIALVLSKVMTPIFMPYYLLFVMPYLAILAAVGIVTLATLGWNNRKFRIITIPVGIAVLALTVTLSVMGIKSYFKTFQKEDWKGVTQFLTKECSESLRLYYMTYMEKNVAYYNVNLKSQVRNWNDSLKKYPSSEELAGFLPDGYKQVCLVLGHTGTPQASAQTKVIQTALQIKYPQVTKIKFYSVNVEIYK